MKLPDPATLPRGPQRCERCRYGLPARALLLCCPNCGHPVPARGW